MVLAWVVSLASADVTWDDGTPPPRGSQTLVVTDPATEGPVRLVMPGRDGDAVYCDGWQLGVLPLNTVLAGGLHEFRVKGAAGTSAVAIDVTPSQHRTVQLDLTPPPAALVQPVAASAPAVPKT